MRTSLDYVHVDVFSPRPYSGNSLAVFTDSTGLSSEQMSLITKELRHFESIFLVQEGEREFHARVYDLVEELGFAGHPVIGAACVLHDRLGLDALDTQRWTLRLKARTVTVETERRAPRRYFAMLDQGRAEFGCVPPSQRHADIASWFSLRETDLAPGSAPEVVSTGLRYLVVPVREKALARARISIHDLDRKLAELGAEFAYLFDPEAIHGRHWNNDGLIEDVATGSGAGCVAAYMRRHELLADGEAATLRQGCFVGRPSEITIKTHGEGTQVHSVLVGGDVSLVGAGRLDVLPEVGS